MNLIENKETFTKKEFSNIQTLIHGTLHELYFNDKQELNYLIKVIFIPKETHLFFLRFLEIPSTEANILFLLLSEDQSPFHLTIEYSSDNLKPNISEYSIESNGLVQFFKLKDFSLSGNYIIKISQDFVKSTKSFLFGCYFLLLNQFLLPEYPIQRYLLEYTSNQFLLQHDYQSSALVLCFRSLCLLDKTKVYLLLTSYSSKTILSIEWIEITSHGYAILRILPSTKGFKLGKYILTLLAETPKKINYEFIYFAEHKLIEKEEKKTRIIKEEKLVTKKEEDSLLSFMLTGCHLEGKDIKVKSKSCKKQLIPSSPMSIVSTIKKKKRPLQRSLIQHNKDKIIKSLQLEDNSQIIIKEATRVFDYFSIKMSSSENTSEDHLDAIISTKHYFQKTLEDALNEDKTKIKQNKLSLNRIKKSPEHRAKVRSMIKNTKELKRLNEFRNQIKLDKEKEESGIYNERMTSRSPLKSKLQLLPGNQQLPWTPIYKDIRHSKKS